MAAPVPSSAPPRLQLHCAWVCTLGIIAGMPVSDNAAAGSAQASSHCPHSAAVEGYFDAKAPNLTVQFRAGFAPYATARMLAQKYHLTVSWVYAHALSGFTIKNIDVSLIPRLQCEPSIKVLSFDAPASTT